MTPLDASIYYNTFFNNPSNHDGSTPAACASSGPPTPLAEALATIFGISILIISALLMLLTMKMLYDAVRGEI